jgi:hypothetical protein
MTTHTLILINILLTVGVLFLLDQSLNRYIKMIKALSDMLHEHVKNLNIIEYHMRESKK